MNKLVLFAFFLIIASLIIASSSAVKAQNYCEYYYKKGDDCRGGLGPTNDWCGHNDGNIYSFCGYFEGSSCSISYYVATTRYYFGCKNCGVFGLGGCCDETTTGSEVCDYGCNQPTGQCKPKPGTPILSSPTNGAVITTLTPTLTWQSVSNVDRYKIFITSPESTTISFESTSNSLTVPSGKLEWVKTYTWKVAACVLLGLETKCGDWSSQWTFTTAGSCSNNPTGCQSSLDCANGDKCDCKEECNSGNCVNGLCAPVLTKSISLSASPTSVPADGSSYSIITAKTSDGATGSGITITFATDLGTFPVSKTCITDCNGECIKTITSSTAGTATVTGSASGYTSGTTKITFTKVDWSIELSATSTSPPAGSSTTLIATTNLNVGPVGYKTIIYEGSTAIKTCTSGVSCSKTVTKSSAGIYSYTAKVVAQDGSVKATSDTVSVTWTPCTPKTCSQLGKECDSWDDGCGGTVNCGSCTSPKICQNGLCVSSCTPSWSCTDWSPDVSSQTCGATFTQTRTCTDSNNCGTTSGKPAESQSATGTYCPSGQTCSSGSCVSSATDFSLSVSPNSGSVTRGNSNTTTLTATLTSGSTQPVSFSAPVPSSWGITVSFSPTSCNPTCTSTMTISTISTTPTGEYTITTITGTGGGVTRFTTYTLTVNDPSIPSISLLASPSSVPADGSSTSTITATTSNTASGKVITFISNLGTLSLSSCTTGTSGSCTVTIKSSAVGTATVTGSASGYTSGSATVAFTSPGWSITLSASPTSLPVGSSTTLTATANQDVDPTDYYILIYEGSTVIRSCDTGTSCSVTVTKSTAGTYSYTAEVASYDGSNVQATSNIVSVSWTGSFDFSLSVDPTSGTVTQGSSTIATVTATLTSGTSQSVSFSASSSPSGPTVSFSPTSCNPNCDSTMTINTLSTTPTGNYLIIIIGTGGGVTETTTYILTVNQQPAQCSRVNPTVSITPPSQSGLNGSRLGYVVTVANGDSGTSCTRQIFTLTSACSSYWTCSFALPSLSIAPGDSNTTTINVTSPSTASGSNSFSVIANSGSYINAASATYVVSAGCSGSVALALNPSTVVPSGSVTPSVSGLSNCDGKTVIFKMNSCTGTQVSACSASGGGCTDDAFTAPGNAGSYSYYACLDKNGNGNFDDAGEKNSTNLTVAVGCPRYNPDLTVNPTEVSKEVGENHTFTITVTNNDSSTCDKSTFNLTTDCLQGWQCTLNPNSLLISPGSSNSSNLTIKSASTAALGQYLINLTVANRADTKYNATKSIGFILISKCAGAGIKITDAYVYNNSAKVTVENNGTAGNLTITSANITDKSGKIYKADNLPITNFDVKETEYINFSTAPSCTNVSKVTVATNCPKASDTFTAVRCLTTPSNATVIIVNVTHKDSTVNATLRNIGTEAIDSGSIKILLNGVVVKCKQTFTLAPKSSRECDIPDFECSGTAKLEITEPNENETEFECEKVITITVQSCKDADCNQPLEAFTKGEEVYFNVETDPADASVTAVVHNGGTETIDLTEPFKPEETGSYTIELTASKEGYSEATSELSFVVEAKSGVSPKIIIVILIILGLAGFIYYRLKKTRKTETYEKLYEKYGKKTTYEDLYRKYGRNRRYRRRR